MLHSFIIGVLENRIIEYHPKAVQHVLRSLISDTENLLAPSLVFSRPVGGGQRIHRSILRWYTPRVRDALGFLHRSAG